MRSKSTTLILLLPAILLVGLLFLVPIVNVLGLSVHDEGGFTLQPFRDLLASKVSLIVLERTFVQAFTVTLICVVLGYPAAYFMSELPARTRAFVTYLILLPFWISILVRTYTWIVILGREGIVNRLLDSLGLRSVQILYTDLAVQIGMVQILLPIVILTCLATMLDIDRGLIKAARSLGATPAQAFLRVFLPLSATGAATGAIICFILCLGFYVTPALLGGRRSILISNLIDLQVHQTLNWGFAAVLASTLLVVTLLCLGLFALLTRGRNTVASIGAGR